MRDDLGRRIMTAARARLDDAIRTQIKERERDVQT
jgi:hypothetical protein